MCAGSPDHAAPPLVDDRVTPHPMLQSDPLPPSQQAEATGLAQSNARSVLGEDRGLQRPDPGPLALLAQRIEQQAREPSAACRSVHINAHHRDARVYRSPRHRRERRRAPDRVEHSAGDAEEDPRCARSTDPRSGSAPPRVLLSPPRDACDQLPLAPDIGGLLAMPGDRARVNRYARMPASAMRKGAVAAPGK